MSQQPNELEINRRRDAIDALDRELLRLLNERAAQAKTIGSLKGALVASLLIGFADTFGKVLVPELAGVAVYLLMAVVLLFRPAGLFGRA